MSSGLGGFEKPERRRWPRIATPEPRPQAMLIVGRKEMPVSVLDESVGGFAILADRAPGIHAHDIVHLRNGDTIYETRVVYIGRAAMSSDGAASNGFRLGLERMTEARVPPTAAEKTPWLMRLSAPDRVASQRSVLGALIMLGLLVIGASLGIVLLLAAVNGSARHAMGEWIGLREPLPTATPPKPSAPNRTGRQIQEFVEQMPGAAALMAPAISEKLTLTEAQRVQIGELVDKTNAALAEFDRYFANDSRRERAEKRAMLFAESRRQALGVLTPRQRAEWEAIVAADSQ